MKNAKVISLGLALSMVLGLIQTSDSFYEAVRALAVSNEEFDKVALEVQERIEAGDTAIPVVIWYDKVSFEEIEEMVEDRIGLSIDELDMSYSAPSDELLNALAEASDNVTDENADDYLRMLMETHMEMTASARQIEYEKTDLYLTTRRSLVDEYYSQKSADLVADLKLEGEVFGFISHYAPMIVCKLSPNEIENASKNINIKEITYFDSDLEIVECTFPSITIKDVMGVDHINQSLNLTGSGVKIGIYDSKTVMHGNQSDPIDCELNTSHVTIIGQEDPGSHPTWCAAVAAGNKGIAPNALIFSTLRDLSGFDWNNYNNASLPQMETLIDNNVKLINVSWGTYYGNYNNWDKYLDYLIESSGVTVVCATGNNENNEILTPSSAYNCISVNGFLDNWYDSVHGNYKDVLQRYSYNNGTGCLKPDVIATTVTNTGGTSYATPIITGMIALLYQYKPSLAAYPQATKAILMASAHKKMDYIFSSMNNYSNAVSFNETMEAGLTERQGAGVPDMYNIISIVAQHSYGSGVLSGESGCYRDIRFYQPKYGADKINVCMAYLQTGVAPSNSSGTEDNYDILLYNSGFGTKTSEKQNSSTEMIYTTMPSSSYNFRLRVYKSSSCTSTTSNIRYGYAWSTNNTKFYPTSENEGIYYVQNKKSSFYLNLTTETNESHQDPFNSTPTAQWILKYLPSNNQYIIMPSCGTTNGLALGSNINGNYYKAVSTTGTPLQVSIVENRFQNKKDGTISFKKNVSNVTYALGVNGNSTTNGATVTWSPYSSTNESQKWYITRVAYQRGDVNLNGIISSADAQLVLNIAAEIGATGSTTYDNNKVFLADYDGNGIVNATDAALIFAIST